MAYYPIAIDLTGKKALVVGGGSVALRKIEMLLDFGANVVVVSRQVNPEIESMAELGKISLALKDYGCEDLADAALVIAATDNRAINAKVSEDAKAAGMLVNVVDDPELCTFIVPATVKRGDLTISISTGGKSPALAAMLRNKIEELIGPEYGELADLMGEIREIAKKQIKSQSKRERVLKEILYSNVLELIRAGRKEDAHSLAVHILESAI